MIEARFRLLPMRASPFVAAIKPSGAKKSVGKAFLVDLLYFLFAFLEQIVTVIQTVGDVYLK